MKAYYLIITIGILIINFSALGSKSSNYSIGKTIGYFKKNIPELSKSEPIISDWGEYISYKWKLNKLKKITFFCLNKYVMTIHIELIDYSKKKDVGDVIVWASDIISSYIIKETKSDKILKCFNESSDKIRSSNKAVERLNYYFSKFELSIASIVASDGLFIGVDIRNKNLKD